MKAKFEFTPEALDADKLAHIKAGDVLLVAPQPQEASAAQGPADTQPQSEKAQPVLGCYLLSAPEEQVGVVPASAAKHLAQYPQLQASVRSVKRSADGAVQQLLVRVEIGPQGPVAYSKASQADSKAEAPLPEYEVNDDGFQLRRCQLEQLVYSEDVIRQLGDPRLQTLILEIDRSKDREKALALALERPEFSQFSDVVLELLHAGLPAPAKA